MQAISHCAQAHMPFSHRAQAHELSIKYDATIKWQTSGIDAIKAILIVKEHR
jgi:hypothetical protein